MPRVLVFHAAPPTLREMLARNKAGKNYVARLKNSNQYLMQSFKQLKNRDQTQRSILDHQYGKNCSEKGFGAQYKVN